MLRFGPMSEKSLTSTTWNRGSEIISMATPTPIFSGNPTMKTFICGTVLATIPSAKDVRKRAVITGAAILIAMVKTPAVMSMSAVPRFPVRTMPPRGTMSKLWASACSRMWCPSIKRNVMMAIRFLLVVIHYHQLHLEKVLITL